jgi:FtsP/CotA-like multicopper oxidase with cupredoxin domain
MPNFFAACSDSRAENLEDDTAEDKTSEDGSAEADSTSADSGNDTTSEDTSTDGDSTDDSGTTNSDENDSSDTGSQDTSDDSSCNALIIPPLLEGTLSGGVRVFELEAKAASVEWIAGNPTPTYGVNGSFLGPTLRFRRGETVRIEVTNALDECTTLHWHGLALPARADGGPYQPIAPGSTRASEYEIAQRSVMAWYHSHQMHSTERQVYMGLAGLIYLDDPEEAYDLPSTYGVDDIPLVIQDRRFAADGTHPYLNGATPAMFDRMAGLKGTTMLVNGAIEPIFDVPKGLVRFRILNGSNARIYNIGFSDNRSFRFIGGDGGLFEKPISTNRVMLGPAERAEILVDFADDDEFTEIGLRSYSEEVRDRLFTGTMGAMFADALDESTFDVMSFRVCGAPSMSTSPPDAFAAIERLPEANAARTRTLSLSMSMMAHRINGQIMETMDNVPEEINFRIPAGDLEIWEIENTAGVAHPIHVRNRHFQVLSIDGAAPPEYLAGWKDTVLVEPGQTMRLILDFSGSADPDSPYMFHCHILEHEDSGMMGQFYIVDPEAVRLGKSLLT